MKYMLLFTEPASAIPQDPQSPAAQSYWGAWGAYAAAVAQSGLMVSGEGLMPPTMTTTVMMREGKRVVQDGPYAESKDILGGFFVIDVPDLDVALEWAARAPSSTVGYTEIRPVLPEPQQANS
jgi:hypothetical protein